MNLAHVHLLLNHFPTVGFGIGVGLVLIALFEKNDKLMRLGFGVLFLIALLTIVVYQSGNAAEEAIGRLPDVSKPLIEIHRDAALQAFILMEITGAAAWLGLWQYRRFRRPMRGSVAGVLILSGVTFALMVHAADLGGEIRHPEIRAIATSTGTDGNVDNREWIRTASIQSFVLYRQWVWPTAETLHFVGLALSFGVVLLLNLRVLGMMKTVPFAALHRVLPWGMLGFGVNLVTGMLFFIASADQYTQNPAFHWKMAFMMVAGVNSLYFTIFEEPWSLGAGVDAPPSGKIIAAATIFLWAGVLYFGRMLPYLGNSF